MPIRVNLKEIFPADSQESTVDKVNFNFNKLLELGVGDTGPIGPSGPQGSAGPVGLTGEQGLRGSTWLVDTGNPSTHVFTDLSDGDFYLDSTSFAVWQYSETSSTWTEIVDFEAIVNYYISLSPSPFNRAISTGTSPQYDRFITFNRRGNTTNDVQSDTSRGQFNTSDNDVLFLTNYNELLLPTAISNFPANSGELYNALLKISVNHSEGSSDQTGRYHLEMGSLYLDETVSPSEIKMSELKHNLKAKFVKSDVTSTTPIPDTNTWINIAQFSMSVPEPDPIINISENGIFEWVTPKYNNEVGTASKSEVTLMFGAEEGLTEFSANSILGDGIDIGTLSDSLSIGIKYNLENTLTLPYAAGSANFALFNVSDGLDGFFFNDSLIQTGGNIEQLHTYPVEYKSKTIELSTYSPNSNRNFPSVYTNGDIVLHTAPGSTVWTSADASEFGALSIYKVGKSLNLLSSSYNNSRYNYRDPGGNLITPTYDNHGHQTNLEYIKVPLTNVSDVAISGKYAYFTRVKPQDVLSTSNTGSNYYTFIVAELDSNGSDLKPIGFSGPTIETTTDDKYNNIRRLEVVGNTAYLMSQLWGGPLDWTSTYSRFIAVDISDPTNPTELDYIQHVASNTYVDFTINKETAYFINIGGGTTNIYRIDISDPRSLVTASNVTSITSGVYSRGRIKTQGNHLFAAVGNKLFVYNTLVNSSTALPSLINGGFALDAAVTLLDIILNDNYAYILGENSVNGQGVVYILDISDVTAPSIISTKFSDDLTAPNRMVMVGNKLLITTSKGASPLTSIEGGLVEIEIDGILAPSANISSLRSNTLDVTSNASFGKNVNIGNGLTVGSGGININGVTGLSSSGPISVIKSEEYSLAEGANNDLLHLEMKHTTQESNTQSGASLVNFTRSIIPSGTYESTITNNRFTVATGVTTESNVIGFDALINSNISKDIYGFKFNRTGGTATGGALAYGLHIQGTDANLLEGTTTIDDVLQLTPRSTIPTGSNGMMYYNGTTHKLMLYANGSWVALN